MSPHVWWPPPAWGSRGPEWAGCSGVGRQGGERPRHPNAPAIYGIGQIKLETEGRAAGYWTTRSDAEATLNARTSGVYLRAEGDDLAILDGRDNQAIAELIAAQIEDWKSIANS